MTKEIEDHSPLPWSLTPEVGRYPFLIRSAEGVTVAAIYRDAPSVMESDEPEANARLIVEAVNSYALSSTSAPDAGGEWQLSSPRVNAMMSDRLGGTLPSTCIDVVRDGRSHFAAIIVCDGPETAKQIVRDRIAVPNLVAALEAAIHAMKSYYYGNSSMDLMNNIEAQANAALSTLKSE
jgi:acid stress-induced BolA-like protein IbaG/YrbA